MSASGIQLQSNYIINIVFSYRSFKNCENYDFKLYPKENNEITKWNDGLEKTFTYIKLNNIEIEEIDRSIFAKWNHTLKCVKDYTILAEEKNGCDCFFKEFKKLNPKINKEIAVNLTEKLELQNCKTYILTIIPNFPVGGKCWLLHLHIFCANFWQRTD